MTVKVIDLGWAMARLEKERSLVTLVTPNDQVGEGFVNAFSISIQGNQNIKILRDALNELFPD